MRSSVACARCRRSKVKCVNQGVGTTCRACETSGRECTYPAAGGAGGGGSRRETIVGVSAGGVAAGAGVYAETPRRRPAKKSVPLPPQYPSTKESNRALVDAVDFELLTSSVWDELFKIFQLHFSLDLPFLHATTFLKPLFQMFPALKPAPLDFASPPQDPPKPTLPYALLLAFLALTSRFHDGLVKHHSPTGDPLVAAKYYAIAARKHLFGEAGEGLSRPSLETTQAALMLALHEWGMNEGPKAWVTLGIAIRFSTSLGLEYLERELDDQPLALSRPINAETGEEAVHQEIKRRTFWSCFILEQYMCSGKYRSQSLHIRDIRTQLPSSEQAFRLGNPVRTSMLGEDEHGVHGRADLQAKHRQKAMLGGNTNGTVCGNGNASDVRQRSEEDRRPSEEGPNEGELSRFIKLVELYGKMVRWSCKGGRRTEEYPPWDPKSTPYCLQKSLNTFIEKLPHELRLNPQTTDAYAFNNDPKIRPYILINTLIAFCQMILHREYIPYHAMRCSKPEGPLDPPLFDKHITPEGYYEASARQLFRSARELMDLLVTCRNRGVLVETPIVGFATYTIAYTGVYAVMFPHMDPDGYMSSQQGDRPGSQVTREAMDMVLKMRPRLKMAEDWGRLLIREWNNLQRVKKEYKNNMGGSRSESSDGSRYLSVSEGGGLNEYMRLERLLKEFGNVGEVSDTDMQDVGDDDVNLIDYDDNSSARSQPMKSESPRVPKDDREIDAGRHDGWRPINNNNNLNNLAMVANQQRDAAISGMSNGAQHHLYQNQMSPPIHPSMQPPPLQSQLMNASNGSSNNYTPPLYPGQHKPVYPSEQASRLQQHPQMAQQQQQQQYQQPAQAYPSPRPMDFMYSGARFGGTDLNDFTEGVPYDAEYYNQPWPANQGMQQVQQ